MKNIFNIFRRKRYQGFDCETAGLNGESIISINDAAGIIRDTKEDFDKLTRILNTMPINTTNIDELWKWNIIARTTHYDIGIDIENLERLVKQRMPSLKDAGPLIG